MRAYLATAVLFLGTAIGASAHASSVDISLSGYPYTTPAGNHQLTNFDDLAKGYLDGKQVKLNGGTLTGSNAFIGNTSDGNGAEPYGDHSNYLSVTGNGSATLSLDHGANSVGFLWGSVDSYNSVSFLGANGELLQKFCGSDLPTAGGGQDSSGTYYANFTSAVPIWQVVFNSGSNSFEIDNLSVSSVPLPAALPMYGAAVIGLAGFRRLKNRRAAAA